MSQNFGLVSYLENQRLVTCKDRLARKMQNRARRRALFDIFAGDREDYEGLRTLAEELETTPETLRAYYYAQLVPLEAGECDASADEASPLDVIIQREEAERKRCFFLKCAEMYSALELAALMSPTGGACADLAAARHCTRSAVCQWRAAQYRKLRALW